MKLKAKRLTAQNAIKLWKEFYAACGPEVMSQAFGWSHQPTNPGRNERVYAFYDDADLIGWGSIIINTNDADDEEARVSRGVFPQHQRKGYRTLIFNWLAREAKRLGASYVSILIYKSNEAHYKRTMREAHTQGSRLIYAGDTWFPAPGYGYFVYPLTEEAGDGRALPEV